MTFYHIKLESHNPSCSLMDKEVISILEVIHCVLLCWHWPFSFRTTAFSSTLQLKTFNIQMIPKEYKILSSGSKAQSFCFYPTDATTEGQEWRKKPRQHIALIIAPLCPNPWHFKSIITGAEWKFFPWDFQGSLELEEQEELSLITQPLLLAIRAVSQPTAAFPTTLWRWGLLQMFSEAFQNWHFPGVTLNSSRLHSKVPKPPLCCMALGLSL